MRKRPLRKLSVATPEAEEEIKRVRGAIRDVYAQVEEASQTGQGKEEVRKQYDRLLEVTSPSVQDVPIYSRAIEMNFSKR